MSEHTTKDFAIARVKMGYPPVIQPIAVERGIFEEPDNQYKLFRHLVDTDDTLWGGIHTAALLAKHCLKGFIVRAGKKREPPEERLQQELNSLYNNVLAKYEYDIAWKMYMDGTVVYALQKSNGVTSLEYLPMTHLTCVATEKDIASLDYLKQQNIPKRAYRQKRVKLELLKPYLYQKQVLRKGVFIIDELSAEKPQTWKAEDCAIFDWGRIEEVVDLLGRYTLGVWNKSPLLALRAKILWKHSLIIGDMQYRDKQYPREHHKLPGGAFDPDLFAGDTYEERLAAAQAAAQTFLNSYADKVSGKTKDYRKQPDQGYVTFDDVEIAIVESKVAYTSPNELLNQIDQSIPAVTGIPHSAITGTVAGRGSFASEVQIGAYLALKAEFCAWQIAQTFIQIAKQHIRSRLADTTDDTLKELKLEEHLDKIDFKLTRVLEKHQLIRDAAILAELPILDDEIRNLLDFAPLTDEESKMIEARRLLVARKHAESGAEAASTARRRQKPERPLTPPSKEQQQVT